jgi:hypothetical protein
MQIPSVQMDGAEAGLSHRGITEEMCWIEKNNSSNQKYTPLGFTHALPPFVLSIVGWIPSEYNYIPQFFHSRFPQPLVITFALNNTRKKSNPPSSLCMQR